MTVSPEESWEGLEGGRHRANNSTIRTVTLSSVLSVIPPFMVGSLAVFLRSDLAIGPAGIGVAVGFFFLASAVTAIPGATLTERVGARASIVTAATISSVAMLAIATVTQTTRDLAGWLFVAGVANGLAQPAGNMALARGVSLQRQGLAFGIKLASVPSATMIAGLAVPTLGATVGWRWAFVLGSLYGLGLALGATRHPKFVATTSHAPRPLRPWARDLPMAPLIVLAVAAACGTAVGTSLATFYVDGAVQGGHTASFAGGSLAVGSLSGILSRLAIGWLADGWLRRHLATVALLLAIGALGIAALGPFSRYSLVLFPATLLAFTAGWGWPGIFNLAIVRLNPAAPASASSITHTGVFVGGVLGAPAFGAFASWTSIGGAWIIAGALNIIAAACILLGRRMLLHRRADITI